MIAEAQLRCQSINRLRQKVWGISATAATSLYRELIPLFRRSIRYNDIKSAEVGRATLFDGWGIHYSVRGGWVWNHMGRDCAVVHLKNGGKLWIGTDDAENLPEFLNARIVGEKS